LRSGIDSGSVCQLIEQRDEYNAQPRLWVEIGYVETDELPVLTSIDNIRDLQLLHSVSATTVLVFAIDIWKQFFAYSNGYTNNVCCMGAGQEPD